jgi:hypothetical protein
LTDSKGWKEEEGRLKTEDGRRKGITCERDQMEMNHVEGEVGK